MEIAAKARLRPTKDEDLIKAWNSLPTHEDKSDVVRRALRLLFFVENTSSHNKDCLQTVSTMEVSDNMLLETHQDVNDEQVYEDRFDDLIGSF
ncbi:hypothetical protein ABHN03_03790 [Paenibacillus sp. NRS-1775]|uniref:hypothetical protein n=1 Tax=unclassified Paenibacillus TaxID=185978 RepID=UPI003D2BD242